MKKLYFTLILLLSAVLAKADSIFIEGFEYANQDGEMPVGWVNANDTWLCGFKEKDHNRKPHTGNWYAYTNSAESWMFMPMNMSSNFQYRFSLWAISDGVFQLEIWGGDQPYPSEMTQLLLSENVSSGSYEQFSNYIADMAKDYRYFGIHAVSAYGYYTLTIDDIWIDKVDQYSFRAIPTEMDTVMHAGDNIVFNCKVKDEGYEALTIYMAAYSQFFTDVHFYVNGQMTNHFDILPDQTVPIRGTATLQPGIEPGTLCWFDLMFTIDCGCATAMFTYWATVDTDGVDENYPKLSLYPNPSTGDVTIEGDGEISIFDSFGKEVLKTEIVEKETITLKSGVYFIRRENSPTEKLIVK
jgi:hypothetical protein